MDLLTYHFIHVCSVMLLFTAFGAIIMSTTDRFHKPAAILHGVSLLLLFVSGMGMLAKLKHMSGPGAMHYWIVKLVILIALGGALALAKRKILHTPVLMAIVLILGFVAAYLGIYKPF